MTLLQLYNKHKKGDWPDKNSSHSYIPLYEEILAPYRHTAQNILEIGLMSGESLRMWDDYFDGTVYGMDCSVTPLNGLANLKPIMAEGKHNILIGDAADPMEIERYFNGIKLDVVVEDASHEVMQQLQIYYNLKPYMNKGSVYIIEDIQNIEANRTFFEALDENKNIEIIDRRHIKNRYDDVLVIIRDK
jgi:hypothetical protein